ncbi:hypothetical protein DdX_03051 [Ditylenchus destructor]|uniref:Uncharacterized protein n=1 Tax=Ditylenchus destructor TaxID=166010 RepID=A0AAD4NJ27_9BILA|nr:hypothetical protein DdX_03051 [Ditylenchus destructor]
MAKMVAPWLRNRTTTNFSALGITKQGSFSMKIERKIQKSTEFAGKLKSNLYGISNGPVLFPKIRCRNMGIRKHPFHFGFCIKIAGPQYKRLFR